ncbi:hypothetical protein [Mesorhizobium sp. ORM16]|uniref:hypothetical protein n=1 Tax=Mesorhizobium sp. ORM16 TaxID=3376989 RepID=UPI0038577859
MSRTVCTPFCGFGLKVGKTTLRGFAGRVHELVAGYPNLKMVAAALLSAYAVLQREIKLSRSRFARWCAGTRARRLMSRRPKLHSKPRMSFSIAIVFCCKSLRVVTCP